MKIPPDGALAAAQRIIADLRCQLADRTAERDEAVAQQTATAEVLGVINASPGDLAPVFDAMLEKAMRLCGAELSHFMQYDGSRFHTITLRGASPDYAEFMRRPLGPGETGGSLAALVRGDALVHVPDLKDSEAYRSGNPARRALVDLGRACTGIWVALRNEAGLRGALVLYRTEVRPFTDKQIALLQNFAAQAVIAIENARLITETREALEQQTATAEVLGVINASPGDLAPVFDAMLERAMRLCCVEFGSLQLYDGDMFRAAANRGLPQQFADRLSQGYRPGPAHPFNALFRGEAFVQVPDLAQSDTPQGAFEVGGMRTVLSVPLRRQGSVIGIINLARDRVAPFSDKQIALLQNFAAQAVIAIENARLITETCEALEQQTATAEVLEVINSSPGNLAPVFDAMLEKAMRLCEASIGAFYNFDGEFLDKVAHRGNISAEHVTQTQHVRAEPGGNFFRLIQGEMIVHVADLKETEMYRSGFRRAVDMVDIAGARTAVWVGLRRDETLLGILVIYRQEVRPFTDKQIALLQNFAAQAVIAMENARLITETREALEQQTATAEVLQVINSSPGDLAPVFDAMLEKAVRLLKADFGILWRFEDGLMRLGASYNVADAFIEYHREPMRPGPESGPGRMMRGGRGFITRNFLEFPPYLAGDPAVRSIVELAGARSAVIAPLRKDSTALGSITIYRKEVQPFSEKQLAVLENFAAQAVIAMENARLITETREALEQQTATSEVLKVISRSTFDLEPVLDTVVRTAARLFNASFSFIANREGERYRPVALCTVSPAWEARLQSQTFPADRGTILGRAALDGRVVQVADIAADAEHTNPEAVTLGLSRTVLGAPLLRDGETIGVLVLARQRVEPFTEQQIELIRSFADQAVIAIENTRLITDTREALEQQTATAEVLGVINSSPGDLAPVFDAMLERAMRLCEATYGHFRTYDGNGFPLAAVSGDPALTELHRQRFGYFEPGPHNPISRFLGDESVVHIADAAASDAYREDPNFHDFVDTGCRSMLAVALRKDGELLGYIAVYREQVQPFSERQIALLQNFAAQAVIAMENARLITETREALAQQTATAEVLGVINSSPGNLAPVFDAMLEKALSLCEAAHGTLRIYDGEKFNLVAVKGEEALVEAVQRLGPIMPAPHNPYTPLVKGERLVHIVDSRETPGYREIAATRERIDRGGIRTWLAVPLRKGDVLLGAFAVYRREVRQFTDKQIALLQNFAAQAVIAMENARLLGELRQRTDEVAELNRGLEERVAEQVEELGRVGRLKRFLAPQLAELIVSQGDEKILESHRREIVVVFCDLRGYTAFTETAEPEEVLDFLREYHGALGPLVSQFEGTLDQFSGDGIMVFFNDPVPIPDAPQRAVRMAMAMREATAALVAAWRRRGCELGFGAGIAQGYATLGQIGFSERSGYTAIGTVCNLAARLCAEAKDGQILISSRVAGGVEAIAPLENLGALELKGLSRPIAAFNVVQPGHPAEGRPNLSLVAGTPRD